MTLKRYLKMSLFLLPLLWFGCATQQQVVPQMSEIERHQHSRSQIRSFGDQHYHALLKYDGADGVLKIKFLDQNEKPVEIFADKPAKASLSLPQGTTYRFNFHNSQNTDYFFAYFFSEKFPEHFYFTDTIYTRKDWLKNLSSFTLKIWIPIGETTYLLEYLYPEKNKI
jgi:hypothetical protein